MRGLIFILLFSVACNHYTKEEGGTKNGNMRSEVVQIIHYSWLDSINDKVASNLSIVKENDTVDYIYRGDNFPDSLYSYKISKGQHGGSVLTFLEKPVFLVDEQVIKINRKDVKIGKYDYNIPGVIDEELNVYFLDGYGIVLLKSRAWGDVITFDKETDESKVILDFFAKDTTGFYIGNR